MRKSEFIAFTLRSPLHLGVAKPDFSFLPTQELIPGSVIRGVLAEYLLRQDREAEIKDYVEDMQFGFFYHSTNSSNLSLPFPTTVLSCKRRSGFKAQNGHGVFDPLLARLAYTEMEKAGATFPVPFRFKCLERDCASRVDRYSGYYIEEETNYSQVFVDKTSQTKVAINRNRKTAEEGMRYSVTAISPKLKGSEDGLVYLGKIEADPEKISYLKEALDEVGIGGLTTRGFGKVQVENCEVDTIEAWSSVEDRVNAFNERLREVWRQVRSIALNRNSVPETPEGYYFSVDLLSPAILSEEGIPTLKLFLKTNREKMKPLFHSTTPVFIGGWSTAWGLPKETTYGAGIGSAYLFKLEKRREEVVHMLEELEEKGVGGRREEGYGSVVICHPFHREVMPV